MSMTIKKEEFLDSFYATSSRSRRSSIVANPGPAERFFGVASVAQCAEWLEKRGSSSLKPGNSGLLLWFSK
jgi:hypothetical protein